jgi:hypothetical protein
VFVGFERGIVGHDGLLAGSQNRAALRTAAAPTKKPWPRVTRPEASDPPQGEQAQSPLEAVTGWSSCGKFGAGEEIRTLDPNLGKVVLYH